MKQIEDTKEVSLENWKEIPDWTPLGLELSKIRKQGVSSTQKLYIVSTVEALLSEQSKKERERIKELIRGEHMAYIETGIFNFSSFIEKIDLIDYLTN